MPLFQSYMEVFVSNSPALLAQGQTVENIAVGQVGILDAKSYRGLTAPTYATNKALYMVWGTKRTSLPVSAVPLVQNKNIYTKLIKGRHLKGWRGKAASRGRNEQFTIGFSGDPADTDTLTLQRGQVKQLFFNLSGSIIDKLYSKQGLQRQLIINDETCPDLCADSCENIEASKIAEQIVRLLSQEPELRKYIRATVIKDPNEDAVAPAATCYRYILNVCDTQDDAALGLVQAQYPANTVNRIGIAGSNSTYEIIKDVNTVPTAFSNAGMTIIPYCPVCPTGYTLVDTAFAYKLTRQDAGNAAALTTVKTDYGIDTTEGASRTGYQYGQSTYVITSDTALNPITADGANLVALGPVRNACVLTTPTNVTWVANGTLSRFSKTFRMTIADSICGTNRLADIQAAYPDNIVTIVDASGDCVHTYETTVLSNCVEVGCSIEQIVYRTPMPFEGANWTEFSDATAPTETFRAGVKFELAVANPVTNECQFDFWSYNYETIHAQISTFDENYNGEPCDNPWPVKMIQQFAQATGTGAYVRELEAKAKSYHLRDRNPNPIVREIEGYEFQAKGDTFYDEYVLEFDFKYKSAGGWTEDYSDSYHVHVYFPEGRGKQFEAAMNSYVASLGNDLDPVVL